MIVPNQLVSLSVHLVTIWTMRAVRESIFPTGNFLDDSGCITAVVYSFYLFVLIDIGTNLVT